MPSWRPMREHSFPWPHRNVILAVFDKDDQGNVELFRCICAEHGAYFRRDGGMLSVHEEGWIPFAWQIDELPKQDGVFSPLWTDYLTAPEADDHYRR